MPRGAGEQPSCLPETLAEGSAARMPLKHRSVGVQFLPDRMRLAHD
jgi:hypothetical protein